MKLAPPAENAASDLAHGAGRFDIGMARRTGIEVLQALDATQNVIVMAASRFEGVDRLTVGHKVVPHRSKPVAPRQLPDAVRAAIDRGDA